MDMVEIGEAALGKGAQEVERRRRLAIGHFLAHRIGQTVRRIKLDAVDDVAAVARQLLAALAFHRRRARLGELAGDAADLDHRRFGGKGHNHGHLQEGAEEITDIVGAVFGEAFGAIAALKQESPAGRHVGELALELARLAGKNQRRIGRQPCLDGGQRVGIGIVGNLHDRLAAPAGRRPLLTHYTLLRPPAAAAAGATMRAVTNCGRLSCAQRRRRFRGAAYSGFDKRRPVAHDPAGVEPDIKNVDRP